MECSGFANPERAVSNAPDTPKTVNYAPAGLANPAETLNAPSGLLNPEEGVGFSNPPRAVRSAPDTPKTVNYAPAGLLNPAETLNAPSGLLNPEEVSDFPICHEQMIKHGYYPIRVWMHFYPNKGGYKWHIQ